MTDEPVRADQVPPEPRERWASRIVSQDEVDPGELDPNPLNWRQHDHRQKKALIEAIETAGFVQAVIVNRTTGHVVDGHLRVQLALERGLPTIPVNYVELTEREERLVLATLDPLSDLAVTDEGALKGLLSDVEDDLGSELQRLTRDIVGTTSSDTESPLPSQGDIDRKQDELDNKWGDKDRGTLVDLTCPECQGTFAINTDEFNVDSRYER